MLDHPEAPWTVTDLAKCAGMSRGSFAATFKESLGESPHAYLSRLRMGLAAQLLRRSEEHTSELQSLMRISYAVFCLKKKTSILEEVSRYDFLLLTKATKTSTAIKL